MLMELIGFLGLEISIFPNTVEVVGLMVLPAQSLIELISLEIGHGQILIYLLK
jgi:hypothetical protein